MRKSTVYSYIGYAIKSRKILYGVDNIIGSKACFVVLYDENLGKSSLDKLTVNLKKRNIKGYRITVEDYYPQRNCKALGITEKNLASAIVKEMEESSINE